MFGVPRVRERLPFGRAIRTPGGSGARRYRKPDAAAADLAHPAPLCIWKTAAIAWMDECRRCGGVFVSGERRAEGGARFGPVEVAGQAGAPRAAFAASGAAVLLRQDRQDVSRRRRAALPRGDDGGLYCQRLVRAAE